MTRPILLLHGWTMRGAVFDALAATLPPGLAAIAPDLPGHGDSPPDWPMLDAAADLTRDLLAAHPGAILVGWSMGAAIAWNMIARHGTAGLAGLVTVDMSPRIVNGADWPHGLRDQSPEDTARSTARMRTDWEASAQAIAATMFATRDGPPGFPREQALRQILSNDPETMRRIWAELTAMDLRAAIPAIDVPYLVTRGQGSRVYPASAADWLAAAAPDASVHIFESAGHSPPLEVPTAMAQALAGFADRL